MTSQQKGPLVTAPNPNNLGASIVPPKPAAKLDAWAKLNKPAPLQRMEDLARERLRLRALDGAPALEGRAVRRRLERDLAREKKQLAKQLKRGAA